MKLAFNLKKDILHLYLFFFAAVIIVYKLPAEFSLVFQILLLLQFYRSEKNYFWLTLVAIIESGPGFLFVTADPNHTFALLRASPVGTLFFWMAFLLVAMLKVHKVKKRKRFFLYNHIAVLTVYFIMLIVLFGVYKYNSVFRLILPWSLLFILPRLLRKEEDFVRFFNLLFSFVFFVILTQMYKIITGLEFSTLFGGIASEVITSRSIEEAGTAIRPVYGIFIPFLSFWGAVYFLTLRKKFFPDNYLYLILGLSFFSIFLTATRSWLIASGFILVALFFLQAKRPFRILVRFLVPAVIILSISLSVPFLGKQIDLTLERYETIEYLLKGDITAGGTLKRFDVRAPRVMSKFRESPVAGWGFSSEAIAYSDGHVGYHNLLLHTGILGFLLFIFLWLGFIFKLYRRNRNTRFSNPYRKTLVMLIAFLLSILILHTSVQWFNYTVSFMTGFTICLLFTLANLTYHQSRMYDQILNRERQLSLNRKTLTSLT